LTIVRSRFATAMLLAALGATLPPRLLAGEPEPPFATGATNDSLRLNNVVAEALSRNFELRSMRAEARAVAERPRQAGALPNPMLNYRGMDPRSSIRFPVSDEKRIEFAQTFPWFGKRGARERAASGAAEAANWDAEVTERDVVFMAKESYYELYRAQRALDLVHAEQEILRRMERIARARFETGRVGQEDVLKGQAELTMLRDLILHHEQQRTEAEARLNAVLGRPAGAALGHAVDAPSTFGIDAGALAARAAIRPEVRAAESWLDAARAEEQAMSREYWPDFQLAAEYRAFVDELVQEDMVMFTVGLELPLWRGKYRAGASEARSRVEARTAALEEQRVRADADVSAAASDLQRTAERLDLFRSAILPQSELRFRSSEAGYSAGRVPFMDLLESERFWLQNRLRAIDMEGELGAKIARLERAAGVQLSDTGAPLERDDVEGR
jgi:outer membrane protein TolC